MNSNFYSNWECNHAFSLIKTDPYQAKICYEEYIKEHPNDYRARFYYNFVLIIIGEAEKADLELQKVEEMFAREKYFKYDQKKMFIVKRSMAINKMRILLAQEKYQECYDFYLNHQIELCDENLKTVIFYCRKKLGLLTEEELNREYGYHHGQIVDYQESAFIDHVKNISAFYNQDIDEISDSYFNVDFPIEKVVEEIKKYIPSEKSLLYGYIDERYVFRYDRCGRVNNKIQDYFMVSVHKNTDELINMYPNPESDNLPYVDLNYLKNSLSANKVKQKSQIEKFRERYNM